MARPKYPDSLDSALGEAEIRELVRCGCTDRDELERKIAISRAVAQKAQSFEAIFGISKERIDPLASNLDADAGEIERVLKSLLVDRKAFEIAGASVGRPQLFNEVKDLPKLLRMFAVLLRWAKKGLGTAYPDIRLLPAIAEYELVGYVRKKTGRAHYKELAKLLGCGEDALKMRYYSYQTRRVSGLAAAISSHARRETS